MGQSWLHADGSDQVKAAAHAPRAACYGTRPARDARHATLRPPGALADARLRVCAAPAHAPTHVRPSSCPAQVFFADADVAFLRDPLPYVRAHLAAGADVLFHTDGFGSSAAALRDGGRLEQPQFGWGPELNTGLFVATPAALPLAEEWCDVLKSDAAFANWKNDQQTLNELMRRGVRVATESSSPATTHAPADATAPSDGLARRRADLISAYAGRLRLGLLPAHLFPSGHVYFLQRQLRRLPGLLPIAVHLTFQNCDQSGKRHRMREARLWAVDPPDYYRPRGGLLSYTPDLPPELTAPFNASLLPARNLRASDAVVLAHFRLVNHQLLQVIATLRRPPHQTPTVSPPDPHPIPTRPPPYPAS